jgi:AbrB family looped-hinge helix DNA binding protein
MEARARVTSKGQVTIPIDVRRALGIEEGDTLAFEVSSQYVTVRKRRTLAEVAADLHETALTPSVQRAGRDAAIASHVAAAYAEKERRRGRLAIVAPDGTARRRV